MLYNYGNLLKHVRKDDKGAEEMYLRAVEEDGQHVDAMGNLANLYVETGRDEEAGKMYKKACALVPGHEENRKNYAAWKKRRRR